MKQVILISGKQGSGKTTLSNNLKMLLLEEKKHPFVIKFADVLYEMHDSIWRIMNKYGQQLNAKKDGKLLQILGTEWGRDHIHQDIWVNIAKYRANQFVSMSPENVVIIDDCRFPNELEAFPEAFKVRLEAPTDIRKARCEAWRDNESHLSETALDGVLGFDEVYEADQVSSLEIANDIINRLK